MFKRIDHIEIVTDRLEPTMAFYTEVLGFTVGRRDRIERPDGSVLDIAYLGLGGTTVELCPMRASRWRRSPRSNISAIV